MKIGIVGNGADKFSDVGKTRALVLIRKLLDVPNAVVVNGHSPLGGVDQWAEEIAEQMGALDAAYIFAPKVQSWAQGYKPRNLEIATNSDALHVILVRDYPAGYRGRRFLARGGSLFCYHCGPLAPKHIKSGACWTARRFQELHPNKKAEWHYIDNQTE